MRNTILPPEGFDPVALDAPDLKVSVLPIGGIAEVQVEISGSLPDGTAWSASRNAQRSTPSSRWDLGPTVLYVPSGAAKFDSYAEMTESRVRSAVTEFVDSHPEAFEERWKLQAFLEAKEIRQPHQATWESVVSEYASFEDIKTPVNGPMEGLFWIESTETWQSWTTPDDTERSAWEKTGVVTIGLEYDDLADPDHPGTAYMISLRDEGLASRIRAEVGAQPFQGSDAVLFEYRNLDVPTATLITNGGPVELSAALQTALLKQGSRSASEFSSQFGGVFEEVARDIRLSCKVADEYIQAGVSRIPQPDTSRLLELAETLGVPADEISQANYQLADLPQEPVDDIRDLARALDAAGAHRFAEFIMEMADEPDGMERVVKEYQAVETRRDAITESTSHRFRDVLDPKGEDAISHFVDASIEACLARQDSAPRM